LSFFTLPNGKVFYQMAKNFTKRQRILPNGKEFYQTAKLFKKLKKLKN